LSKGASSDASRAVTAGRVLLAAAVLLSCAGVAAPGTAGVMRARSLL